MSRSLAWLSWGLLTLYGGLVAAVIVLDETVRRPGEANESSAETLGLIVAFTAFAVVGALVSSRQPRNAVGWLSLACPLFAIVAAFSEEYVYRAYVLEPGSLPFGALFAWLYGWTWYPALAAIGLAALLFPNGRPPARRWRLLVWVFVASVTLATTGAALSPGGLDSTDPRWPDNPLGIEGLEPYLEAASAVGGVVFLPLMLAVLASVVVRFRRSRGDERQQLKWMLAAILLIAALIAADELVNLEVGVLFGVAIALVPVAAGIAMLRYRLYDVDVVIRKTLVYGVLTAVLVLTYAGVVIGVQEILRPLTEGSDLAIAVSTLVVAALFLPVRSRVQRQVDRRFYRRRYDAQRTLETFGSRLRDQVDLDTLAGELEAVVTDTVQPAATSLWLRREASA